MWNKNQIIRAGYELFSKKMAKARTVQKTINNYSMKKIVYFCVIILIFLFLVISPKNLGLITIFVKNYDFLTKPVHSLVNIFTPSSGLTNETIDWRILWMKSQIEIFGLGSYALSEKIYSDDKIVQRIGEVAWPVMYDNNSKNIFITQEEEQMYSNCSIISVKMELIFEKCP